MTAAYLSEASFMGAVIDFARWRKWWVFHDQDARRNPAGLPDLLMIRRERLLVAELKRIGGRLRPAQRECLDAFRETAAEVFLWTPSDWPEIERVLA